MDQHLSISEARAFTGKSETTIKRLIKEITSEPGHPDRGLLLPPPEEIERRKAAKEPYSWRIDQTMLLRRFPPEAASENRGAASTEAVAPQADLLIQVLQDQLTSKDRQIETLETQLDRKDEQISSLNERMRESNVLMRELQQRLAISPAREAVVEPVIAPAPVTPPTAVTPIAKKKAKPQKRGVWSRFFRRAA